MTSAATTATTVQLVATARFSDGTTSDVTAAARWDSSNTSVALVWNGLVTLISIGDAEVHASYRTVTGTFPLHVTAAPPHVSLDGTVYEVPPGQRPLAAARVEIMVGSDIGKAAVSDSTGAYHFTALNPGLLIVKATRDGYEAWQAGFTLTGDRHEDMWLAPVPPTDGSGASATARCKDGTWSWSRDPLAACTADGGIAYAVCPGPLCVGPYAVLAFAARASGERPLTDPAR